MVSILFYFLFTSSVADSGKSKIVSDPLKITLFSVCLYSHLREILGVASELALDPDVKVTVVLYSKCKIPFNNLPNNIIFERIESAMEDWTKDINTFTVGEYAALGEADILKHYVPLWKDLSLRPDSIVADIQSISALELGEIYHIPVFLICTTLPVWISSTDEDLMPNYATFYTIQSASPPFTSSFGRTFYFIAKKVMVHALRYYTVGERNKIRNAYGLKPVSRFLKSYSELSQFAIIENFFGFEEPMLLPPNIELVGIIRTPDQIFAKNATIEEWINNSKATIYVSCGSISSFSTNQILIFNRFFKELSEFRFLISAKEWNEVPNNVLVSSWINQLEVLDNPKVVAFITHGGYTSIIEAVNRLVPLLCLPKTFDHFHNCAKVAMLNLGRTVLDDEMTQEILINRLLEILGDATIKPNLQKLKEIENGFKGERRAAEIIVRYTKVGFQHLISEWERLPSYKKLDLDVYTILVLLIAGIIWNLKCCCCSRRKEKVKTN